MNVLHDDIVFVCGKRRSGKSYFLAWLLGQVKRWIMWDINWEYEQNRFSQSKTVYTINGLVQAYNTGTPRIIYRPKTKTPENFNIYCKTVFRMSNIVCAVEEIERYATSHHMEFWNKQIVDIGRHRGIGLFCTARRTKRTNPDILFNSDHIVGFHQRRPEDIEYLVDYIGENAFKLGTLPEFHFVWYVDKTGKTHVCSPVK